MRRRSVETWDLISTPTPEMTEVYREQYGYDGPAAEHGYPRNDALAAPGRRRRARGETRARLGIAPDQTAVLYAPTWRDHLATRPRAAAMSEHLDVDAAAAALGDSHVILLRGHRFHTPGRSRPGVVDVTDHPEINELILASDVAGARLLLAALRLRADRAADGVPGARPGRLHRRVSAASCSRSTTPLRDRWWPPPTRSSTQVRDVPALTATGPGASARSTSASTPARTAEPPSACSTRSSPSCERRVVIGRLDGISVSLCADWVRSGRLLRRLGGQPSPRGVKTASTRRAEAWPSSRST